MSDTPNPGSDAAVAQGCTCPRLDNHHGSGWMGGVLDDDGAPMFVINGTCPLHARKDA